jgi:hypothetical protein
MSDDETVTEINAPDDTWGGLLAVCVTCWQHGSTGPLQDRLLHSTLLLIAQGM